MKMLFELAKKSFDSEWDVSAIDKKAAD